jgi:hypothetical protein
VIYPTWRHFGGKTNWFGLKKKRLKESSWFQEPKSKLRSKVVHFFWFFALFHYFLSPLLSKLCENEIHVMD